MSPETVALQLPSIASLACHTLAIALIPLLVLALALSVHDRRSHRASNTAGRATRKRERDIEP